MKSINKLAVAAVLALSSASLASAATIYHVTGSTAFRVAVVSAEVQICGGNSAYASYYGSNTSLTGANESQVQNGAVGSATIIFENDFSGSISGDETLVDGIAGKTNNFVSFPHVVTPGAADAPTNNVTAASVATSTAAAGGVNAAAPSATESVAPDIAFSDVSFDTADQIINASTDKTTTQPTATQVVGIIPFVFVANGTSDQTSKLANLSMDPQKFTYVWNSGGFATLSFFTGVNADEAVTVYPFGRDADSGTRSTALSETGYGLDGSGIVTSLVSQYLPYSSQSAANSNQLTGTGSGVIGNDTSLTNPTIAALNTVPLETVASYKMVAGDGGYNSGGNLATGMSTAFTGSATVVMTYLGVSDAKSALTASGTNRQAAQLMAYNGVSFYPFVPSGTGTGTLPNGLTSAQNQALIYEGKYTFWGYEHANSNSAAASIVYSNSQGSSNPTLYYELFTNSFDTLSSNGVAYNSMNVFRTDDGQNVQ